MADPSALAGVAGIVAPLFGGAASAYGSQQAAESNRYGADQALQATRETNVANAAIADANRQFQRDMSSSAYTRAVADMKTAGLNPAVMLQGAGAAASTPAGSTATMQSGAETLMASARERGRIQSERAELAARTASSVAESVLKYSLAKKARQETDTSAVTARHMDEDIKRVQADTKLKQAETENVKADVFPKARTNAYEAKHMDEEKMGAWGSFKRFIFGK